MARECGEPCEGERCPDCEAAMQRSLADFLARGGYHPRTRPVNWRTEPWKSRDQLIREETGD